MLRKESRRWWEDWRGLWTREGVRRWYTHKKTPRFPTEIPRNLCLEDGRQAVRLLVHTVVVAFNKRKQWFVLQPICPARPNHFGIFTVFRVEIHRKHSVGTS